MIKIILALATLIPFHSLFAASHHGVHTDLKFSEHSHELAASVPSGYLRFVQEDVSFFEGPQKEKFEMALSLIEEVMNSEEFKVKVIGYHREYSKNYLWSDSHKRLSNEDVYQVIMAGNERSRPGTPGEMNFNSWLKACTKWETIRSPFWCTQVIGSTTPQTSYWIKLNWNFYKNFEVHEMVANMVHEWIHLLGFLHGDSNLQEEVPYVVGDIAGQVAKNLISSRQ